MNDVFKTIAAALVDLNINKQDVINENNKLPLDYIDGDFSDLVGDVNHKLYLKYDLIGVEVDNLTSELNHGDSYLANITDAEEVKVIVGGVDFTDIYYSPLTKVIDIPYVSGNVNIIASNASKVEIFYVNKYISGSVYISNKNNEVIAGQSFETSVIVNQGYQLDNIQVLMGGEDITSRVWDSQSLQIIIGEVTNNIYITVDTSIIGYNITYQLVNCVSSVSLNKVTYDSPLSVTILPNSGHTLVRCYYLMNGVEHEAADGTIVITNVTGDVIITAVAEVSDYEITYNLQNATIINRVITASYNSEVILNYTVDYGYDPENPGVTVTGAEYSVNLAALTITISHIMNNVLVLMNPGIKTYSITYVLSNSSATSISDRVRQHGEQFTTVITPNDGYMIDSVIVSMDGLDITEDVYNIDTNVILIGAVTGNVSIMATGIVDTLQIFNMLSNVRTSNSNLTMHRYQSYAATLSYDDVTYKGIDVVVTMGGEDITVNAYNAETHEIYIDRATDNITIMATTISFTYYNFIYNLTDVYIDYTPASLREDVSYRGSYSTSIPNPYYELLITMGGVDVTDQVVTADTRTISIEQLTGHIEITIVGKHTLQPLTFEQVDALDINRTKTILLGSPMATSGYFLGYNGTGTVGYGNGFIDQTHMNAVAYETREYANHRFTLKKNQDTRNGDYEIEVLQEFTVSGRFNNTSFTEEAVPFEGYTMWRVSNSQLPFATRASNVTVNFPGRTLPQTIYVKIYKTGNNSTLNVFPISGGEGVIELSSNTNTNSVEDFYPITMTSNSLVLNTQCQSGGLFNNDRGYMWILVPNNIIEVEVNTEVTLVGDPYYTIQANTGPRFLNGTTGATSWSPTAYAKFTVNNNYLVDGLVTGVDTNNLIRFINSRSRLLTAGNGPEQLVFTQTQTALTSWLVYEI